MRKITLKSLCTSLLLALIITLAIPPMPAEAKGKATYYCASCLTKKQAMDWESGAFGYLRKISFTKNKVITWGALIKHKSPQDEGTMLKDKKRTFKLSNKVKIRCGAGGTSKLKKVSKRYVKNFINEHSGYYCEIKIKSGKVTEITLYP